MPDVGYLVVKDAVKNNLQVLAHYYKSIDGLVNIDKRACDGL
jgi:hypothetical protein